MNKALVKFKEVSTRMKGLLEISNKEVIVYVRDNYIIYDNVLIPSSHYDVIKYY